MEGALCELTGAEAALVVNNCAAAVMLVLTALAHGRGVVVSRGEQIEIGFSVVRDTFLFTNRRLILVDIQGLTGKKTEYLSIPFSKITKFSIETLGNFDLDAELKIWVGSDPTPITKQFNKKVNIYQLQQVLAQCTL